MKIDLCLEGGGIRGIAHVGALKALENAGFEPSHVIGTSAGSIVASLIAAGFTPDEMYNELIEQQFDSLLDAASGTRLWNLYTYNGIYKGDKLRDWIAGLLQRKGVVRFGDVKTGESDPRYSYRLRILTTDLTNQRLAVWPDDAPYYDVDPDQVEIADAIRASVSIPFVYRPYAWNLGGSTYKFVDGGVLSNYPIWFYDSPDPTHPTFGLLLQGEDDTVNNIGGLFSFAGALLNTIIVARDKHRMYHNDTKYRSIVVPTGSQISTLKFNLTNDEKLSLWYAGFNAVEAFLEEWTWEKYKEWALKERNQPSGLTDFLAIGKQGDGKTSTTKSGNQSKVGKASTRFPIWEGYAGKGIKR